VDGRPLAAYVCAYFIEGRVYAPVSPLLTRLADRVWFEGRELIIERDGRRIRVKSLPADPTALDGVVVAAGPVLRALGASVQYDPRLHRLVVRLASHGTVASPTPFDARAPEVVPNAVFTPLISPTPRPIWTGTPLPRRTALPVPPR
jgi:hypothetical protein